MVVLDHRAPSLESAHGKRDALEVVARVVKHFIRVPVVSKNCVSAVHTQNRVKPVIRRLRAYIASRPALLPFADNVALLRFGRRSRSGVRGSRGCDSFGCRSRVWCRCSCHTVCATCWASAAAAMSERFLASAAFSKASGSWTPIIRHCSLANFCKLAICSA